MAKEEQEIFDNTMVTAQGYQLDSSIINSDTRSITPDSFHESGDTFLAECSQGEIMENSDTISAVSLESAYCNNTILDDVASTISNTNSCPEFTRQPEPVAVFSERLQPSIRQKTQTAPSGLSPSQGGHKRIRRIPSGANPRHRVSTLYRPQRSQSVPHIQFNPSQTPRRFSHSQINQGVLPTIHVQQRGNSGGGVGRSQQQSLQPQMQQKSTPQQQQQQQPGQQQQQQIIYLQIPNPNGSQSADSQELQQQIALQLHQLVPQICTQLLQQMGTEENSSNKTGILNQTTINTSDINLKTANQLQQLTNDSSNVIRRANPRKRKKDSNYQIANESTMETLSESVSQNPVQQPSQTPQSNQPTPIAVPSYPAVPQLTIPLPQELLLQCQQLREQPYLYTYQPRLETIHEEISLKRFKVNRLSKPKMLACILTVLCVIVVIVLAGDKTVAVIIITVIFIIFLFGLLSFLYLNTSRNPGLFAKENRSIQFGGLSSGSKSSMA